MKRFSSLQRAGNDCIFGRKFSQLFFSFPTIIQAPMIAFHSICRQSYSCILPILFVLLLSVSAASVPLAAQLTEVSFHLQDTTVQRGTIVRIAIRASFRQLPPTFNSMRFTLRYTPLSLAFERATGGGLNVMQCPTPRTDSQFVNLNLGAIHVSCSVLRPIPANADIVTLAVLEFRTLASPDLTTSLTVDSLSLDGRKLLPVTSRPALVTIQGAPLVAGEFPDAIGQNYPNPSTSEGTTFPYTVATSGLVDFALISSRGDVVVEFPTIQRGQGRYLLQLPPNPALSGGMYILRMITPRGVYYRNFLLRK